MNTALLATKLYFPPYRPNLVARPRLLARLDEGLRLGRKITLVSAPAGFGKTTLIVEWLAADQHKQQGGPGTAWLSLDEGDNELSTFVTYLVAALKNVQPTIGETTMRLLAGERLPSVEALFLPLLNDLAVAAQPFVLVLDDYHTLRLPELQEAMALLIERQPPQMHVVITTRQDPLLPVARWRARGWLTEVRMSDLRFSEQEAADFLNRSMGLSLQAQDIQALEARTEGWIAGLQLAAVSLQQFDTCGRCGDEDQAGDFIRAFAGDDRYIMEYLVEEVLCCQTQETQDFLLQTAILERFNAALCDAVIEGRKSRIGNRDARIESEEASRLSTLDSPLSTLHSLSSQPILDYLDKANMFLIPLDSRREWYRYHHLFAELLRHRLERQSAIGAGELHRRAAVWLEANGYTSEAIRHAMAARDYDLMVEMITRAAGGGEQWSHGEASALVMWLNALPPAVLRAHPELEAHLGRAYYVTGRFEEMKQVLDRLDARLKLGPQDDPGVRRLQGELALNRILYETAIGNLERTRQLALEALEKIPEDQLYPRSRAYFSLGIANDTRLHYAEALEAYEQAIRLARSADAYFAHTATVANLSWMLCSMGQLRRAELLVREAIELESRNPAPIPLVGSAYAVLCFCLYERNQLEEAESAAVASIEHFRLGNIIDKYGWYHLQLATTRQAMGNAEGARQAWKEAEDILAAHPYGEGNLLLSREFQARLWMGQGEQDKAVRWAREYEKMVDQPQTRYKEYADMAYIRVLVYEKRFEAAWQRLDGWIAGAEAGERWGSLVAWYAWRAAVMDGLGKRPAALADLKRSLELAEPEGYVRSILDLGEPARSLLQGCLLQISEERLREYAGMLLAAFPSQADQKTVPAAKLASPNGLLVEPLTDRELEVLALMSGGLSNVDIARKLFLSTNTLKAHSQSIYSKLDVHSRMQAVLKARELGLLPASN